MPESAVAVEGPETAVGSFRCSRFVGDTSAAAAAAVATSGLAAGETFVQSPLGRQVADFHHSVIRNQLGMPGLQIYSVQTHPKQHQRVDLQLVLVLVHVQRVHYPIPRANLLRELEQEEQPAHFPLAGSVLS